MSSKEEKVEAFRLYDFDKSDEFKAYMRNVELPPGDRALLKVKAKWYKRVVDPDFDLDWLPGLSAHQTAADSVPQPGPKVEEQQQHQQQPAGSTTAGGSSSGAGRTPQWEAGRKVNLAILQALILVFSLIYMQPLQRSWSYWAYGKLMIMLVVSQALRVHTAHGLPQTWSLDAIKAWLMRVLPTSDAQYFLLAFAAAGNKPVTAVLPPFMVLAAYNLAAFLSEACAGQPMWQQYGAPLYRTMQAKQQQALAFNAQSEIMLGFMLIVGLLLPSRAPMFTFMTWQFLRMRYWSADAALYHRQAWAGIDRLTAGFRAGMPILQKAVDLGGGFFNQARHA